MTTYKVTATKTVEFEFVVEAKDEYEAQTKFNSEFEFNDDTAKVVDWSGDVIEEIAGCVYVFDCGNCGKFYGENALTHDNRLFCPACFAEQNFPSPFVTAVGVGYVPEPFWLPCENCNAETMDWNASPNAKEICNDCEAQLIEEVTQS